MLLFFIVVISIFNKDGGVALWHKECRGIWQQYLIRRDEK